MSNFGKIYESTWWGNPIAGGWGGVYAQYTGNQAFEFTVNTALGTGGSLANQFEIPTGDGTFLYDVKTSDGYEAIGLTGDHTITFPSGAGIRQVSITGRFPQMQFTIDTSNTRDSEKLLSIDNFGIYGIGSVSQYLSFYNCANMQVLATDLGHFSSVESFYGMFGVCTSLTSIPLIDTSAGRNFRLFAFGCNSLTTFPNLNFDNGTDFFAVNYSSPIVNFPLNMFDNQTASNFSLAFSQTNLSTQSIDGILVSIDVSGVLNGNFNQGGGQAPSSIGIAAKDNLLAKGWSISYTN
tara:strand:- start:216 stop:1097 length:882 start_codon:yes stop_codon:yes gene_type:complete